MTTENPHFRRSANFSATEIKLLIRLINDYRHVIENQKTDTITCKTKEEAWIQITNEFNACNPMTKRTPKNIKTKYENMKKRAKKRALESLKTERLPPNYQVEIKEEHFVDSCDNDMLYSDSELERNNQTECNVSLNEHFNSDNNRLDCDYSMLCGGDSDVVHYNGSGDNANNPLIKAKLELIQLQKDALQVDIHIKNVELETKKEHLLFQKKENEIKLAMMKASMDFQKLEHEKKMELLNKQLHPY